MALEKINVGVVGLNFGRYVIDNMLTNGAASEFFTLAGICAISEAEVEEGVSRYGCKGFVGIDALLEDPEIPVIILMTGPNGRAELIRKIIRAGKDVMTTKPFEQDSKAAASVLREARERGQFVYLNSPAAVMNRDFTIIRDWETKYDLGKLVGGHHECWYKSVETADGSWYDDPELCPVAPVLRLGIYGLNDMLQLFGEPDEVQVMETRHFTGRPTPDMARLCVKFKDGAMIDTLDGWAHQPRRGGHSMILYYENGTIYRNPPLFKEGSGDPGSVTTLCVVTADSCDGTPTETTTCTAEELSSFYAWETFYHAVRTRVRPQNETPDAAIVNVIRVLEAAKRASSHQGFAKV